MLCVTLRVLSQINLSTQHAQMVGIYADQISSFKNENVLRLNTQPLRMS